MIWILNLIIGKSLLNRNLIMKEYNKNYGKDGNLHKNAIFTKNGTMFALKLKSSSVRAKLFKEKKFGANQVIEDIDDDNVLVTMDMQINPSTYNFILGCGDLVEVIEPQWLKDKIKELSKKIYEKY